MVRNPADVIDGRETWVRYAVDCRRPRCVCLEKRRKYAFSSIPKILDNDVDNALWKIINIG